MRNRQAGRAFFGLSAAAAAALCAVPAVAQETAARRYQLSGQALGSALRNVSVSSGQAIVAPSDLVAGKTSRALVGTYSAEDAVARLLEGSGLVAVRVGNALVIRRQSAESAQDAPGDREGAGGEDILVTGTRIRGRAPVGAQVISIDRKAIEQSGRGTVQSLLQTIPQNFGGGPGETTNGVARGNADLNGTYGSGVNLRGLGVSSTLVLLNGERPPMAGLAGVFTDLSMIPLSAVERIELLADGASALYGSDAVAGVVNIVPRDRFTGLETSARYGRADGLNEIQFSGIAGLGWSSGHAVLAYGGCQRRRMSEKVISPSNSAQIESRACFGTLYLERASLRCSTTVSSLRLRICAISQAVLPRAAHSTQSRWRSVNTGGRPGATSRILFSRRAAPNANAPIASINGKVRSGMSRNGSTANEQEPLTSPGTCAGTVNPSPRPSRRARSSTCSSARVSLIIAGTSDHTNPAFVTWLARCTGSVTLRPFASNQSTHGSG
jgi:hypothetical protein